MAQTTVVPFSTLPACATSCYHLYDANGACVPPVLSTVDTSCFCSYGALQPWRTGTAGVCDGACTNTADMSSIIGWFDSYCSITAGEQVVATQTSSAGGSGSGASSGSSSDSGGGDWISNHWKWVVMLAVLVVAIAGIWIGACIWRRRYIRRKDRAFELAKHAGGAGGPGGSAAAHASWGPGHGNSASNIPWAAGATGAPPPRGANGSVRGKSAAATAGPGVFMPTSGPVYDEKPRKVKEKKKWVVKERT